MVPERERLGRLKTLLLYKNALESLPESMAQLKSLTTLNCFNNKLTKLPAVR